MTNMEKIQTGIYDGIEMFVDKLEEMGKSKTSWTLDEMRCVSDIMKDLAETHKHMAKAHYMYAEHSPERY